MNQWASNTVWVEKGNGFSESGRSDNYWFMISEGKRRIQKTLLASEASRVAG